MWPIVDLFEFFQLGVHWASRMGWFMSFTKFGKYLAIIPSNILYAPFSLLSFWVPITYMLVCSMVSHRSASFSIKFSSCSSDKIILIDLSSSPLILSLPAQICCWIPLVNFSFQLLYFSTSEFLFLSPYWEIVLMWPWESFLISVRLKWFNDIIGMLSLISLDCPEN